jgi:tetratricopeptide (TPR) repeat protein
MKKPAGAMWLALVLVACSVSREPLAKRSAVHTTSGSIAIANLDHAIAQTKDEAGVVELLLTRSRFLADYEALERAATISEEHVESAADFLRRARTRAAVHRFADALGDVAAAERLGADGGATVNARASIFIAMGRARDVASQLEARVVSHPGYASGTALASAYAMLGRLEDADHLYAEALDSLDTTSPFPYAWIYFARGVMWAEQGGDSARAAGLYRQALEHLPEFVAANVHLAELAMAHGDVASAIARIEPIAMSSDEPEALALLGDLHMRTGQIARGRREIERARERYESLLSRHPLAFADHAAEFYLGAGANRSGPGFLLGGISTVGAPVEL